MIIITYFTSFCWGAVFHALEKPLYIYNTENTSLTTRSEIPGSFQEGKCRVIVPSDLKKI